jgi:hypothetical protein
MQEGRADGHWPGHVILVNPSAEPRTGRIPVLVRVTNPEPLLRCYVEVGVRFAEGKNRSAGD